MVIPAVALSLLASVALVAGSDSVVLLFVGRLLAGISSGAVFGAGTAWLRETATPPVGSADVSTAVRRAAVAMTIGFAAGPLVAGLLAQWGPAPRVLAYVPHIVLMLVVLVAVLAVPETVAASGERRVRFAAPEVRHPRFRRVVAPMAPWVFAAPAVAFALLPSVVGANRATDGIALTAAITSVTALAGVLIQPLARRLEVRARANSAAIVGLLVLTAGLLLSAVAAHEQQTWMLVPCAIVLGAGYGLCLVAGLLEVQRLAGDGSLGGLTAGLLRAHLPRVRLALPVGAGRARRRLRAAAGDRGRSGAADDRTGRPVEQPDFPALSRGPERRSGEPGHC